MSYWDTSCIVKLYTPEPDSEMFRDYLAQGVACVSCDITALEFWATVRRKEAEGVLAPGEARKVQTALESDLADGSILIKPCDSVVRSRFYQIVDQCHSFIPPIFIRTNDALHLAAAGLCRGDRDRRLGQAPAASRPCSRPHGFST